MRTLLYCAIVILFGFLVSAWPQAARASDHADPMKLEDLEAGLTGLFAFPDGDRLVIILATRRNLTRPGPYNLEPFEFTVHMDLHSRVSYKNPETLARYGGEVVEPTGISADATLRMRLDNNGSLRSFDTTGLHRPERIRTWSGVRDDPFIFPRFFGSNVIAMVVAIPFDAFPGGQQDWLLWATTTRVRDGSQIDHVGRASRTQLARFDFLNTLPPAKHVAAIHRKYDKGNRLHEWLTRVLVPVAGLYEYVLEIRHYDLQPDVMVYTTRRPPGYPNGRRLTDDIVGRVCAQGDCILQELAFAESRMWPRPTVNDKPFLAGFPYLAEPWPDKPGAAGGGGGSGGRTIVWAGLIFLLALFTLWRWRVRLRKKQQT
jgi:hypothetical protein